MNRTKRKFIKWLINQKLSVGKTQFIVTPPSKVWLAVIMSARHFISLWRGSGENEVEWIRQATFTKAESLSAGQEWKAMFWSAPGFNRENFGVLCEGTCMHFCVRSVPWLGEKKSEKGKHRLCRLVFDAISWSRASVSSDSKWSGWTCV